MAVFRISVEEAFLNISSRIFEVISISSKMPSLPRKPDLLQLGQPLPFANVAFAIIRGVRPASFMTASEIAVGCLHFPQMVRTSRWARTATTELATR